MLTTTLKIQNCNNIKDGEIVICQNKLNILFGRNGTGKSTIARAITLAAQGKELTELTPYASVNTDMTPNIEMGNIENIAIFNDEYVNQYVYQNDTVVENAFEVLVRSPKYDIAKEKIDKALAGIKNIITDRQEIVELRQQIGVLLDAIKLTSNKKIAKRGGVKAVLGGKGAYKNPPVELSELKPFFEDDATVSKWADWRHKGYEQFGSKGICPYCSVGDTEQTQTINKVFTNTFDKPSVETVLATITALEGLKPYLNKQKTDELIRLFEAFGDTQKLDALESLLEQICSEADYLHMKLTTIIKFNGTSIDRENISDTEKRLNEMRIAICVFNTYFVSDLAMHEINLINAEIDKILENVGELKGEIAIYNKHIYTQIESKKQDINQFLNLAGFKYEFDIDITGEGKAKALLKFILSDGTSSDSQSLGNHLSWGEKHSFALILFMFDAIRTNKDLIILDDPISSFDSNKKYAIINRLFKTGESGNSFYEKTVLLLTHDFEPIIDYVQTNSGRQSTTSVCATYFENVGGQLNFMQINRGDDLMSSVVLFKELSMSDGIDIAARIGCLRKFIEHQYKKPREESNAYNVLSSLIHGRAEPTSDSSGNDKLTDEQINEGVGYINNFISDFDYDSMLSQCSKENLLNRYSSESSAYIKMLILRAYTQQTPAAKERLRKKNDVLRKYVDEQFHIENDYIYSLDVRRFNIVPDNHIRDANNFIEHEKAEFVIPAQTIEFSETISPTIATTTASQ